MAWPKTFPKFDHFADQVRATPDGALVAVADDAYVRVTASAPKGVIAG